MSGLPSGTVSLLFSDIEGSTGLLSRLGPAYADALDGQRRILREAWADHGGVELGTEGDSFYVVFSTAPDAVAAAVQAQRELAEFDWPAGEQVRVRMGIHTGSPTPHDGAYVGMDVHRAARVAGAAHGGQVLVSEVTQKLITDSLPERVALKDLGSHQLKDIPSPERLYQLTIQGLDTVFPPPKTLGAASSLPRPPTPMVGRDGEVAELTALLGTPDVRLVTLTGPGGTGKTRLAIAVAQKLLERFPDGVYFVPLAAVTTADVMWTSIAEVLDVPPEGRIPPGFFDHVAHRSALIMLDNLEQIGAADTVVTELLDAAPQVLIIATSRRPLHVPAEHEHAVPPLELPKDGNFLGVERSGAVQLFVQQARKVKTSFSLTATNAADVAAVCQRLDGLPLAIELAAARSKLLSPAALLARLDKALDLSAPGRQGPSRQKTLRDTIAWSHNLLDATQQACFSRLGVFAGGADLDAVEAVTADALKGVDPLDLVAELVNASLATITEDEDGEPRFGMLGTVRAFALDRLAGSRELDEIRQRHAHHYLSVAEEIASLRVGQRSTSAGARFETEHDNFREALRWALDEDTPNETARERLQVGVNLSAALGDFWLYRGYWTEGVHWLGQALHRAGDMQLRELAYCHAKLARILQFLGDADRAHGHAKAAVDLLREGDNPSHLVLPLRVLAAAELNLGRSAAARTCFEEAVRMARTGGDKASLSAAVGNFALFQASVEHNYIEALRLHAEAIHLASQLNETTNVHHHEHNMACTLRLMGRTQDAETLMRKLIPQALDHLDSDQEHLATIAEDYAAILADLGKHCQAVKLLGSADALRERLRSPRPPTQQADIAGSITNTRAKLSTQDWEAAHDSGRNATIEAVLAAAIHPGRST